MSDQIIAKIPRADDLEIHIKYTVIEGLEFLNIREYVPTRDWYGRGISIPLTEDDMTLLLGGIYAALDRAGVVARL